MIKKFLNAYRNYLAKAFGWHYVSYFNGICTRTRKVSKTATGNVYHVDGGGVFRLFLQEDGTYLNSSWRSEKWTGLTFKTLEELKGE